jgi:two-component system response regulator
MYRKKKILLVEDNSDDIELTLRAFKKNNIMNEIIVKTDGKEALDFFFGKNGIVENKSSSLPILILLDLKLPKVDGIGVLKKLKADERTNSIPVVILTSSKEPDDLLACYKLGCNSSISKPEDINLFTDIVKAIWF